MNTMCDYLNFETLCQTLTWRTSRCLTSESAFSLHCCVLTFVGSQVTAKYAEAPGKASEEFLTELATFIRLFQQGRDKFLAAKKQRKKERRAEKAGEKSTGDASDKANNPFSKPKKGPQRSASVNNPFSSNSRSPSIEEPVSETVPENAPDVPVAVPSTASPPKSPTSTTPSSPFQRSQSLLPTRSAPAAAVPSMPARSGTVVVARTGPPTREGFLTKKSGGKSKFEQMAGVHWDKRWFELSDTGYLHYFKKQVGVLLSFTLIRISQNCTMLAGREECWDCPLEGCTVHCRSR